MSNRLRFICTTETDAADALASDACDLIDAGLLISHRDVIDVRTDTLPGYPSVGPADAMAALDAALARHAAHRFGIVYGFGADAYAWHLRLWQHRNEEAARGDWDLF